MADLSSPPHGLVAQLHDRGLIPAHAHFEPLYGGRSNQVWKVFGGDSEAVLKLYRTSSNNPLFRNDADLEAACLAALRETGFVPILRATGTFAVSNWVFYDHATGNPWRHGTEKIARLLRKLHGLSIEVAAPEGCNGSADLERHGSSILTECRFDKRSALFDLKPQTEITPTLDTCLVHGDPVAGNILVSPSGLTLIDWQCPALGDPCEDLAIFLSPAMQLLYRGSPLTEEEESAFLGAYGQPDITERYLALRPWYAWRMAAYCLWRIENGDVDYARGYELEAEIL